MGLAEEIKKAALGNNTKIQSSEAAELEKILNKMFYLDKNIEEETEFVHQVMTRGLNTQERAGLHASAIIVGEKAFCLRSQVLSLLYKQLQGEQIDVKLRRIFEEGNAIHEKWQRLFIRAGYGKARDMDRSRFNYEYEVSYTPDGIVTIPEFYDEQMVLEIKSVNTYQFKNMTSHPSGQKQMQFYMYLTGLKKGFVLAEDKNTQDFKVFIEDYDPSKVSEFTERLELIQYHKNRALELGKMVKRPADATSPVCKRCAECAMKLSCWNLPGGKTRIYK